MPKPPALPRLNRVEFYRLTGDEFLGMCAVALEQHAASNPARRLSRPQRVICAWSRMTVDVPNGGYEQFFYNNGGDRGVPEAAALFDELELPKVADLLRNARNLFRKHKKAFQTADPWDGVFGSIPEFDKHDRQFLRVSTRGTRAIERWARTHIDQLAVGDDGAPLDPAFTGEIEVPQANGLVGQYLQVKKGKPSGAYREFFDDGSVRRVEFYKAGKVSGDYWPDGQLKKKESKRGNLTVIEWFYPSGALHKRFVKNKDGEAAEPVRFYYENGQLAEEQHVVDGDEQGPWLKFFEDGSPRLQARYEVDSKLIVENAWDDDGTQVVKNGTGTFHFDGKRITAYYELISEYGWTWTAELKNGVRHGKCRASHMGVLWSVEQYVRGRQHGESTLYWENGRVRTVSHYDNGEAVSSTDFPKFDQPVPAVVLTVEADTRLYEAWRHMPVDEFPRPLNLDAIRKRLKAPAFLNEVYQRNLDGAIKSDYEDWNTFDDGIAYFLTVDETGRVSSAFANGSSVYSGGEWETYPPILKALEFSPGRIRGKAVECRVLARVDHTFVEGSGQPESA